ncbi:DUF1963 domain-containing protein [Micromonospora sp. BRA006-A]|nr:DUF1963 domain-containing protein [Micromonospora sp. BRA006-A]
MTRRRTPRTRTGGVPLVPTGFEWPVCDECDGPMQFLAQVRLDDIDAADATLLSIFMCQNDPGLCDEWDATAGGNRAFVFPSGALAPSAVPSGDTVLLAETSAVTYVPMQDSDGYDEARERWRGESGRPLRDVLGQLGGLPAWLQFDQTPTCPACAPAHVVRRPARGGPRSPHRLQLRRRWLRVRIPLPAVLDGRVPVATVTCFSGLTNGIGKS